MKATMQSLNIYIFLCVTMVLILDGSSDNVAHVWSKIGILREKKIRFDGAVDVTECLSQIDLSDLLHMSVPRSELHASSISTICSVQALPPGQNQWKIADFLITFLWIFNAMFYSVSYRWSCEQGEE